MKVGERPGLIRLAHDRPVSRQHQAGQGRDNGENHENFEKRHGSRIRLTAAGADCLGENPTHRPPPQQNYGEVQDWSWLNPAADGYRRSRPKSRLSREFASTPTSPKARRI